MHNEFAEKLRLTSVALGCVSQKELCARFFAVNRATHCTLPRLQKWMQGRAMPRSGQFYEDWVKVLGLDREGGWMVRCTKDELRALLANAPRADASVPAAGRPVRRRAATAGDSGLLGGLRALGGSYAAYSPSWSPPTRGRVVRGSLRLRPNKNGGLQAIYRETIATGVVRVTGEVTRTGRTLGALLHETGGGLPLYFSLITPSPPMNVMCGILAGVTWVSRTALPSASRILLVRVPDTAALDASNRYLEPGAPGIAADLAALGLGLAQARRLDAMAGAYFADGVVQVETATQVVFSELFDPLRLHGEAVELSRGRA